MSKVKPEISLNKRKQLIEQSIKEVKSFGITTSRYLSFLNNELYIVDSDIQKENDRIEKLKEQNNEVV